MEVILPEGEEDMGGGRWKIMSGIKLLGHSKNVVWQPRPLRIIVEGSGVSSINQLYQSQGFLRSNQIAETHGRIN